MEVLGGFGTGFYKIILYRNTAAMAIKLIKA
jgi:hypothetical protein